MTPPLESRQNEANKIFASIFRISPSARFVERYARAAKMIEVSFPAEDRAVCDLLISQAQDLESIEFAARFKRRHELLTAKFRLALALAECEPEMRSVLVNSSSTPLRAWCTLISQTLRSIWKLAIGLRALSRFEREHHG